MVAAIAARATTTKATKPILLDQGPPVRVTCWFPLLSMLLPPGPVRPDHHRRPARPHGERGPMLGPLRFEQTTEDSRIDGPRDRQPRRGDGGAPRGRQARAPAETRGAAGDAPEPAARGIDARA